ncbi:MAG: diguanylate cyclase [Erysipelotrichaceae bacterium]
MNKSKLFKRGLLLIILITAIIVVTADFVMSSFSIINHNTYNELEENAVHYNEILDIQIKSKLHLLESVAKNIEISSDKSKEMVQQILNIEVANGSFNYLLISDLTGRSIISDGLVTTFDNGKYYQQALSGKSAISNPVYSKEIDSNVLIIAVPFYQDGSVQGVIRGIYDVKKLSNAISAFSRTGYGFIVDETGTIILSSDHKDRVCNGNNLFDFFKQKEIKNSLNVNEFKEMIMNKKPKTFDYTYKGEKRYATFMAMGVNNWYTFSFASDTALKAEANRVNAITFQLVIKLVVIFFILALYIYKQRKKQQLILQKSNENYETLVANIKGGVVTTKRDIQQSDYGIVTYASLGFSEMTGYTMKEINTLFKGRYRAIVDQRDLYKFEEDYFVKGKVGSAYSMQYRIVKKDGSTIWVMDNSHIILDEHGNRVDHGILTEITDMKQQEENLRLSEARFKIATQLSSSYISEFDLATHMYTHVENAEGIFKISAEAIIRDTDVFAAFDIKNTIIKNIHYFYDERDFEVVHDAYKRLFKDYSADFEARVKPYQGDSIWCQVHFVLIEDEEKKPKRIIATMSDIDEMKKEAQQLKLETQLDPLTGLYNKVATRSIVDRILKEDFDKKHVLVMIDVDNFKGVNDTLGHLFGDAVLMEVFTKLKKMFRAQDILGRVGGDEFLVFIRDIKDVSVAYKKAGEICKAFKKTYIGDKQDYQISCSVGIVFSNEKDNFDDLFNKADIALYQAKENGKDRFHAYNGEENNRIEIRAERQAIIEKLEENQPPIMLIKERVFEMLYGSYDFYSSINLVLALLGRIHDVNHVYIFEILPDQEYMSNTFEWCSDRTNTFIDQLQKIKMPESIYTFFSNDNDSYYCSDLENMDERIKPLIFDDKVVSTLQILVRENSQPFCFVGFDDYKNKDGYSINEVNALRDTAKIIGVFLKKRRLEEALSIINNI